MMEIILKTEIRKLGERGDIVTVANGYARNYLLPQQLAIPATAASKKQIEQMQAAAAREAKQLRGDAEQLAAKLDSLTLRTVVKAGESLQLFGSITTRDVAALLAEQDFEIDRHKIILEKPIKLVGDYEVSLRLYKNVRVTVKVEVRAEGREDELPQEGPSAEELEQARAEAAAAETPAQEEAVAGTEEAAETDETSEAAEEEAAREE